MNELLSALETSTWINSWVSSEARSFPFKTMIYKRHHPIPGGKHKTSRATHKMRTQGYSWLEVAGGADFWWSPSPQRDTGQEPAPSPERVVKIPRQILFILFQRSIMKYCTEDSLKTTLCYLWQIWRFLTRGFIQDHPHDGQVPPVEGKEQDLDSHRKQIGEQVVWGCVEASVHFYLSTNFLFKTKTSSQQFSRDTSHLFFHLLWLPHLLGRIFQPSASWRMRPEETSWCHSHSPGGFKLFLKA